MRKEHMARRAGTRQPPSRRLLAEVVGWLSRAQDRSASADGGVAWRYSLDTGWGSSYPETTGYIVPTLLDAADALSLLDDVKPRVKRMLDWLESVQFSEGGFQAGPIGTRPKVAVAFNTGQVLLGLARGVQEFGEQYREPMRRAADWLVEAMDADGCWRKFPSPFTEPGGRAYDVHAAWGLLEAARLEPTKGYERAALRNVAWALTKQRQNGWFNACGLSESLAPVTHTIGYALRGLLEAYRFFGGQNLLHASLRTADALLRVMRSDGFLPGRLSADWRGTADWACLTGSLQIACCWFILYQLTGRATYLRAGRTVNGYVGTTVRLTGTDGHRGGVAGSFPVTGEYLPRSFPNWAAKFFVDSYLLEARIRKQTRSRMPSRDGVEACARGVRDATH